MLRTLTIRLDSTHPERVVVSVLDAMTFRAVNEFRGGSFEDALREFGCLLDSEARAERAGPL